VRGCKSASECLADATGDPFFIGEHNASRQHDYPIGCFLENMGGAVTQSTVWLNNGTLCAVTTGECPSAPKGTPICIVSSETTFASASTGTTDANATLTAATPAASATPAPTPATPAAPSCPADASSCPCSTCTTCPTGYMVRTQHADLINCAGNPCVGAGVDRDTCCERCPTRDCEMPNPNR
jgi:hypothetical protein